MKSWKKSIDFVCWLTTCRVRWPWASRGSSKISDPARSESRAYSSISGGLGTGGETLGTLNLLKISDERFGKQMGQFFDTFPCKYGEKVSQSFYQHIFITIFFKSWSYNHISRYSAWSLNVTILRNFRKSTAKNTTKLGNLP